jgi:hypothetical protein
MATLREYYLTDFANALTFDFIWQTTEDVPKDINIKVGIETLSSAKFIIYYVPRHLSQFELCVALINACDEAIKKSNDIYVSSGFPQDIQLGAVGSIHSIPYFQRGYTSTQRVI